MRHPTTERRPPEPSPASARRSAQALVEALRSVGFFLIVEQLGERVLAWSSLVYACQALVVIPSQAFAETAYTKDSGALGRSDAAGLRP